MESNNKQERGMNNVQQMISEAKENAQDFNGHLSGSSERSVESGDIICSALFRKVNYAKRSNWNIRFSFNKKVISKANVKCLLEKS